MAHSKAKQLWSQANKRQLLAWPSLAMPHQAWPRQTATRKEFRPTNLNRPCPIEFHASLPNEPCQCPHALLCCQVNRVRAECSHAPTALTSAQLKSGRAAQLCSTGVGVSKNLACSACTARLPSCPSITSEMLVLEAPCIATGQGSIKH